MFLTKCVSNKAGNVRDIEARPCNRCCSGKPIIITYSERVSVALGIQYTMRMRHIVVSGFSGSNIFFHTIS
jgi:(2Fe-2S) ferredoxin